MKKSFAVCIAGPTACGKTSAAVAVCRALGGEVVSMDSMQIYRGMDVGTAKPDEAERGGVVHHLLDFLPPTAVYSASEYQRDASRAAEEILSRGRLPVFAGGTGLYLQSVKHPMRFAEAGGSDEIRARLHAQAETEAGRAALWTRLCALDAATATHLHPNDVRRVVRALEIYETTGRPMSESCDWEAPAPMKFLTFGLRWPREEIWRRTAERVDDMLRRGLAEEVRRLLEAGVPREAQAMQAIGYKEIAAMLYGECSLEEATEQIKIHTRQYAKKQMTWLARDVDIFWLDCETFSSERALHEKIIAEILAFQEEQ